MSGGAAYLYGDDPVEINAGRAKATITVSNTGDRAIQVGSHYHFFEANRALDFDRNAAFGKHLDIPAGTAVRFEPGDTKDVTLAEFGGHRRLVGFSNLVDGGIAAPATRARAIGRALALGFKGTNLDLKEDRPRDLHTAIHPDPHPNPHAEILPDLHAEIHTKVHAKVPPETHPATHQEGAR